MLKIDDFYDVVIIGAGPAGSTVGRYCAEKDISVLIIERDIQPGASVKCGEGISYEGLHNFIEPKDEWLCTEIDTAQVFSPDNTVATLKNIGKGYILDRTIFDRDLAIIAGNYGARIITNSKAYKLIRKSDREIEVKFIHNQDKISVRTNLVVGADGVESLVGRWAGLKTNLSLKDIDVCKQYTLTQTQQDENICKFYFGNNIAPGGYIWVFPKSSSSANVGIGVAGNKMSSVNLNILLDNFVRNNFKAPNVIRTIYGALPTSGTLPKIVTDNVLLVGDAARQTNPLTGGGIAQAFVGARLASETIFEALKKQQFDAETLNKYETEWNQNLGKSHKIMYDLKKTIFGSPDEKINRLIKSYSKIPPEKFSFKEFLMPIIKHNPGLVLKLASSLVVNQLKVV